MAGVNSREGVKVRCDSQDANTLRFKEAQRLRSKAIMQAVFIALDKRVGCSFYFGCEL
jgi:hypothetical protein